MDSTVLCLNLCKCPLLLARLKVAPRLPPACCLVSAAERATKVADIFLAHDDLCSAIAGTSTTTCSPTSLPGSWMDSAALLTCEESPFPLCSEGAFPSSTRILRRLSFWQMDRTVASPKFRALVLIIMSDGRPRPIIKLHQDCGAITVSAASVEPGVRQQFSVEPDRPQKGGPNQSHCGPLGVIYPYPSQNRGYDS
jgi:hypothetical protein